MGTGLSAPRARESRHPASYPCGLRGAEVRESNRLFFCGNARAGLAKPGEGHLRLLRGAGGVPHFAGGFLITMPMIALGGRHALDGDHPVLRKFLFISDT